MQTVDPTSAARRAREDVRLGRPASGHTARMMGGHLLHGEATQHELAALAAEAAAQLSTS